MDFQVEVDIAAPADVVWSVVADVEHWPEWTASVRAVRLLGRGPLAVGSRALVRQPRLPPAVWTVTVVEPGQGFTWKSGLPGMRVVADHSVLATLSGTRVTLSLHFAGPLGRLFARMTSGLNMRYMGMEAAGLKARSEGLAAKVP